MNPFRMMPVPLMVLIASTVLAAVILALVWLSTPTAAAQGSQCSPFAAVEKHLAEKYDETPTQIGASPAGAVLLFKTTDGATWTLVLSTPTGLGCMIANGTAWQDIDWPAQGPQGDPA